ncbi:MAG: GNAT family N-acetyltransferase [Hyphomicrobiales bacterium]|uniref:GNAT family N-acetyltransferase n=1 Tax=Nisaea sp. TaxID=2024842 RepID=UPI00327AF61E
MEQVRDLIVPIQRIEFGIPITYEDQPDLHNVTEFYRKGAGEFWVAEMDGAVVGSIALMDIGNQQSVLRKMFVREAYRGREHGIASLLLQHLIAHAESVNFSEIILGTTSAFRAAHRFYEKAGFQRIDEDNLPTNFPRLAVDTIFYRLPLVEKQEMPS